MLITRPFFAHMLLGVLFELMCLNCFDCALSVLLTHLLCTFWEPKDELSWWGGGGWVL